jgi:hypothetical protein
LATTLKQGHAPISEKKIFAVAIPNVRVDPGGKNQPNYLLKQTVFEEIPLAKRPKPYG